MRSYLWPLSGMVATQAAGTAVLVSVPVLAPEIADELGVTASFVGIYTGLLFAAATMMLAHSGKVIARLGAVGANQLALIGSALALLVVLVPSLGVVLIAAVLVGVGYGPNTPSGSQVLAEVVPAGRRSLAFSIKQSGAPLGGIAAGATLPWLVESAGWRAAVLATIVTALVVAALVEPLRRQLDRNRAAAASDPFSALSALREIWQAPRLRWLTAGAFLMMLAHGCYQTFFVAYLVEGVGQSLALAGALYAVMQGAAALGRIGLGWMVDRWQRTRTVLMATAVVCLASTLMTSFFTLQWSLTALVTISVAVGITSSGWYGVFLAELARRGRRGAEGHTTGGALFFVYWAVVVSPFLIALVVYSSGSYQPALWLVAVLSGIASLAFLRS